MNVALDHLVGANFVMQKFKTNIWEPNDMINKI